MYVHIYFIIFYLSAQTQFFPILASPDIVRSTVLEGCIPDGFGQTSKAFALEKSSDFGDISSITGGYLVGSASFQSMITNFVKNVLQNSNVLPLNYFSIGRQYWPIEENSPQNLYNTQQSTCVSFLTLDFEGEDPSFVPLMDKIKEFYDTLDLHYRIVQIKSENLSLAESLRIEIQMWSPLNNDYICVGSLSKYGEFVSKRLNLKYYDSEKQMKNYSVMHGTIIDTFKVLGCIIENKAI